MSDKISIKLKRLIIKNFRGIGSKGVEIELNNIVVLVGPNNSGKSTILKVMNMIAENKTEISIDDFYQQNTKNKPAIEIWSEVFDADSVTISKEKWIDTNNIVKEQWNWSEPNQSAKRIGFRVDLE